MILNKKVKVVCQKEDKYGRSLCNIQLENGEDVSQNMIKCGIAFEYQGGTKKTLQEQV